MSDSTDTGTAAGRPTVMFVIWGGFVARYFLRTGILKALLGAGVRVVALVPDPKAPHLLEELAPQSVELEPLRGSASPAKAEFWSSVRQHAMAHGHTSLAFRKRYAKFRVKQRRGHRLRTAVADVGIRMAWRSRALRAALVRREDRLLPLDLHADVFERAQPDLVVMASTGYFKPDRLIAAEARRRGVPIATVISAWDNATSNGYGGVVPDRVIAWSDRMAGQIARHQDIPPDRLRARGVALFDPYVSGDGIPRREDVLEAIGASPGRRTILFATCSPRLFGDSLVVAEHLAREIARGALGAAQLVVRLHPAALKAKSPESAAAYRAMASRYEHVHIDVPDVRSSALSVDVSPTDTLRLAGLLMQCDVFVNVFSTMTLEACLVDKPTVLVNWTAGDATGDPGARRHWMRPWMTPAHMRWADYAHQEQVVARGAVRIGSSLDEVARLVRAYLDDPARDRAARADVARLETGPTDGRAGERIAQELLALLGVATSAGRSDEALLPVADRG